MRKKRKTARSKIIFPLIVFAAFAFGCQPNPTILNSGARNTPQTTENAPAAERPQDDFAYALERVQKSGFSYIFVIRRKDGAVLDADDKSYIKIFAPAETNQFILTDGDRAVIAGSNYPFPPESLEKLGEQLSVEDFSPKNENANQTATPDANADK